MENHLDHAFREFGIKFEHGSRKNVTENKKKPDFLFPSFESYHNEGFPGAHLRVLGAKSSCKDRWRQVLSEANKIEKKHLLTLQPGISQSQTSEMQASNLQLVVPESVQASYTEEQQGWLMSLREFTGEVLKLQR
ncbi:hypothetical protein E1189_03815 [Sansalvadorimonas verongulae]|nr:hypothetical protein [Sansalvadorimonas verongulae]